MAGRILIVDALSTNRIMLKVKLSAAFYDVVQAGSTEEALAACAATPPDLIIADHDVRTRGGLSLCKVVKSNRRLESIPVIAMIARHEGALRQEALRDGAEEVLAKPTNEKVLLSRVRNLMRARDTEQELRLRDGTRAALGFAENQTVLERPIQVALIGPDRATSLLWRKALSEKARHVISAMTPSEALSLDANTPVPDIVVLSAEGVDNSHGLDLVSALRSADATRHSALVLVSDDSDGTIAAQAFDLGANDVMPGGFDAEELALRLQTQGRRKLQSDRLRDGVRDGLQAAVTDPLTGLYNRRYALPHLTRVCEKALARNSDFAVMVADLDHFKSINDTFGHAAGDAVLVEVARRLTSNLRAMDLVARIGGEEFLIVMPETGRTAAIAAATRLCSLIHEAPFDIGKGKGVPISLSIGVAVADIANIGEEVDIAGLLAQADNALYAAKNHGRNMAELSPHAA